MFPIILQKLQASLASNTNTTIDKSNIIDPQATEILSNTALSNSFVIELFTTLMANSQNTLVQIIYIIIKDNPYAIFLVIVISVFLITIFLRLIIYIFTQKPKNMQKHLGKRIINTFLSSRFIWTGLLLGVIIGVDVLSIPRPIANFVKGCTLSILLWIFYNITQKLITIYTRAILIYHSRGAKLKFFKNRNVFIVLSRSIHALWFILFVTILLGLWGVELGPILAGLGIVGIVVGLALQDSFSHIVGGVSLMLDETYTEGDYVILDNKYEGIIFQIGYRSTKLRTFDEEIIVIPNGVLSKMIIMNLSQPVKRTRINIFTKTYATDATPHIVKDLLKQASKNTPGVLRYPEPYVFFLKPEGSFYHFRLNFYISSPLNKLSAIDAAQQEIVRLFQEHNIRFGLEENLVHLDSKNTPIT